MNAQTHRSTSDAMTILFELLRDNAGKAPVSYAFMAIVVAVVGFAAACSIKANRNPR